jgi:signal transduction histidine kinase/DNA-binding response OmpR family regulator
MKGMRFGKRAWIIAVNSLIILSVIAFVAAYAGKYNRDYVSTRVRAFEDRTFAEEQITANYLRGEQQLCDSWAAYIRANSLTMEEAVSFVRSSLTNNGVTAAVLYADTPEMDGLSASPKNGTKDDYSVSYRQIHLFPEKGDAADEELPEGRINITRAYTNPINGIQSIAFYDRVTVNEGDAARQALLMRIVPTTLLEKQWVFPKEEFQNAEVSLIDEEGNYIIRSNSFKNTNFYEFYKSYNTTDLSGIEALTDAVASSTGSLVMRNSRDQECLVAYTPMQASDGWSILAYLRMEDLGTGSVDWLLIGVVTAGLLLLLLVDAAVMLNFNRRLRAAVKEADAANRAKTDFLSTMSHDIRTPMNAIIGLTTIAEKNLDDRDSVSDCLRKIGMAGSHLLTLINDILDISKVESGRLTLNAADFSIVETAENLVNLSQPMVKEKNLQFNFRVSGIEKEWLSADQLRLNQICINLLSNAVKYTEPGGSVSVNMSEEPAEEDGFVLLTYIVSDTGIGMTPEFMAKMYQPFSRQTDSRVNTIQGTGLGLAITKQMVELMNGTIDCESAPGQGTTFTVKLKLPAAKRKTAEMSLPDADVLVVDDDEVLCETAVDTLHSLGAQAESASGAEEALEKILGHHREGHDWSVIILDWKMPGMNGAELARRIRQEIGDDVPILLVSAYDWSDIEEEAKNAGVDGFVSKPLFRSTLYQKLSDLLGREASAKEAEDDNSDLAGMKILVAEDNDINWEIISMLMQMNGIDCDRAENGQIAVDLIREAPEDRYDLIFMDIQMPVMNGLDATRAIRALPVGHAKTIPIIAMTADAFSENVAECLDAGMNGHIAKPIDIGLVLKEIRKIKEKKQ